MLKSAVFLLALTALCLSGPGARAEIVRCYDPDRNMQVRMAEADCQSSVVAADQAKALQAARRAYIQKAIEKSDRSPGHSRPDAAGSGFFVNAEGYVLTNYHVVSRCKKSFVLLPDGSTARAGVVASSQFHDLALLKTDIQSNAFAVLTTSLPTAGEPLEIIGFPMRKLPRRQPLNIEGKFLGERFAANGRSVINVKARVWQGSSGSAVIDRSGAVVGIVFAKANLPAIYRASGRVLEDRAFAMSSHAVAAFLQQNGVASHQAGGRHAPGSPGDYSVRVDCVR